MAARPYLQLVTQTLPNPFERGGDNAFDDVRIRVHELEAFMFDAIHHATPGLRTLLAAIDERVRSLRVAVDADGEARDELPAGWAKTISELPDLTDPDEGTSIETPEQLDAWAAGVRRRVEQARHAWWAMDEAGIVEGLIGAQKDLAHDATDVDDADGAPEKFVRWVQACAFLNGRAKELLGEGVEVQESPDAIRTLLDRVESGVGAAEGVAPVTTTPAGPDLTAELEAARESLAAARAERDQALASAAKIASERDDAVAQAATRKGTLDAVRAALETGRTPALAAAPAPSRPIDPDHLHVAGAGGWVADVRQGRIVRNELGTMYLFGLPPGFVPPEQPRVLVALRDPGVDFGELGFVVDRALVGSGLTFLPTAASPDTEVFFQGKPSKLPKAAEPKQEFRVLVDGKPVSVHFSPALIRLAATGAAEVMLRVVAMPGMEDRFPQVLQVRRSDKFLGFIAPVTVYRGDEVAVFPVTT